MMASSEFALRPAHLGGLGPLVAEVLTPLSPLALAPHVLSMEEIEELRQTGLLGPNGTVAEDRRHALQILAQATYYARVRLYGSLGFLECMVYTTDQGEGEAVTVVNTPEELIIRDPAVVDTLLEDLKQYTGESRVQTCPEFQEELSLEESVALAGLLDLQRRADLEGILSGGPAGPCHANMPALMQAANADTANLSWLTSIARVLVGLEAEVSQSRLEAGLAGLAAKGLATADGDGFVLAETPRLVAGRLPVIEHILSLDAARQTETGDLLRTGFSCVQSGVTDLLHLEAGASSVHWETLSAAALIGQLTYYLSATDALREDAGVTAPLTMATPKVTFCTTCGAELQSGWRFCAKCKTPVATAGID